MAIVKVTENNNKISIKELTPGVQGPQGPQGPAGITSEYADSYTGQIGVVQLKKYHLDPLLATDRTITKFFGIADVGGCTAELRGGGTILATLGVTSLGVSAAITSPNLSQGNTLTMEIIGNTGCQDFRFMVGFTL